MSDDKFIALLFGFVSAFLIVFLTDSILFGDCLDMHGHLGPAFGSARLCKSTTPISYWIATIGVLFVAGNLCWMCWALYRRK